MKELWGVEEKILTVLNQEDNKKFGAYCQQIAIELGQDKGYVHSAIKRLESKGYIKQLIRKNAPKRIKYYIITDVGIYALKKKEPVDDWDD